MNLKLTIQYDGTRYDGWQRQGNTGNTIQGKLEGVLSRMAGEAVEIHGAGRTDAGVHALGQVASVRLPGTWEPGEVRAYLNRYLPEDIAVIGVEPAGERFHARLNAVGKTYRYAIRLGDAPDVFRRKYQLRVEETLDLAAMERAAAALTGRHDYRSFCSNRRFKKSTVRTVDAIRIVRRGTTWTSPSTGTGSSTTWCASSRELCWRWAPESAPLRRWRPSWPPGTAPPPVPPPRPRGSPWWKWNIHKISPPDGKVRRASGRR